MPGYLGGGPEFLASPESLPEPFSLCLLLFHAEDYRHPVQLLASGTLQEFVRLHSGFLGADAGTLFDYALH